MTAPERIPATTDEGTGLVLPIAKALTHVMTVYTAITREWPLSAEDAVAELEDAANHLRGLNIPHGLITTPTAEAIQGWIGEIQTRASSPQLEGENPTLTETISIDELKLAATDTWQLLTQIDRELTGLNPQQTDPGGLP